MRRSIPGWLQSFLVVLLLAFLVGLGYANYRFALSAPGGNDFLSRWNGAHMWLTEGVNPYDPQVSLSSQLLIYGHPADPAKGEDIAHFVYPLPAIIFFAPFGLLPYTVARAVWMTLLELALPALALIGIRLADWKAGPGITAALMVFSVVWYDGFRAIIVGQFAVVESLLLAGALLAVVRRQDLVAGILLGLSIAKPQMAFLLVPYVLLWAAWNRRWPIVLSTLITLAVLIGGSLAVLPTWPLLWLRQVVNYPTYTALGPPVSIIADLVPPASGVINLGLSGLVILYMLWEWISGFRRGRRALVWVSMLTLTVTNLVAFRTATTNYVVLLPALCLVFSEWAERWRRKGLTAVVLAVAILGFGLWGLFVSTVSGSNEAPIMYLPLPILTLVGLWWVRWWAMRWRVTGEEA